MVGSGGSGRHKHAFVIPMTCQIDAGEGAALSCPSGGCDEAATEAGDWVPSGASRNMSLWTAALNDYFQELGQRTSKKEGLPVADPVLKKDSFGACGFERLSPSELALTTPALNVVIPFEDALKLNLAIDECVRRLGRYNRAKAAGKSAALMMVIHLGSRRVRIQEGKLGRPTSCSTRPRAKTRAPG